MYPIFTYLDLIAFLDYFKKIDTRIKNFTCRKGRYVIIESSISSEGTRIAEVEKIENTSSVALARLEKISKFDITAEYSDLIRASYPHAYVYISSSPKNHPIEIYLLKNMNSPVFLYKIGKNDKYVCLKEAPFEMMMQSIVKVVEDAFVVAR